MPGTAPSHARHKPGGLAVGLVLAAGLFALLLPSSAQTGLAALLLVAGGLPHGASDHLTAGPVWRARLGRAGLPLFVLSYLGLALLVFALWRSAPVAALLGFLALSGWHFANEDSAGETVSERIARGLMPLGLPALLHPLELRALLTPMLDGSSADARLVGGVMAAAGIVTLLALATWWWLERPLPNEALAAAAVLTMLPPLLGFALFFALVHARRAARRRREQLELSRRGYARACAPTVMGGTAVLMAAGWWLPQAGLAGWLVIGLAALTVPHMLLVPERAGRK